MSLLVVLTFLTNTTIEYLKKCWIVLKFIIWKKKSEGLSFLYFRFEGAWAALRLNFPFHVPRPKNSPQRLFRFDFYDANLVGRRERDDSISPHSHMRRRSSNLSCVLRDRSMASGGHSHPRLLCIRSLWIRFPLAMSYFKDLTNAEKSCQNLIKISKNLNISCRRLGEITSFFHAAQRDFSNALDRK